MDQKEIVSDEKIIKYLKKLESSFGLRKSVSEMSLLKMRTAFSTHDYKRCIYHIQKFFLIDLILLVKFKRNKPASVPPIPSFLRLDLSDLGLSELKGIPGSLYFDEKLEPAYVYMPGNLPLWGTSSFRNFRLKMVMGTYLQEYPFESFVTVVAHEMCHIILYSTRHELKDSEIATDLLVLLLGFSEIARKGIRTGHSRLGYLDVHQSDLAYRWVRYRNSLGLSRLWNWMMFKITASSKRRKS